MIASAVAHSSDLPFSGSKLAPGFSLSISGPSTLNVGETGSYVFRVTDSLFELPQTKIFEDPYYGVITLTYFYGSHFFYWFSGADEGGEFYSAGLGPHSGEFTLQRTFLSAGDFSLDLDLMTSSYYYNTAHCTLVNCSDGQYVDGIRLWSEDIFSTTIHVVSPHAVPEPEIYAMFLAGLGLTGFVVRRRKQKSVAA